MISRDKDGFVRRINRDGTIDSICKHCYATICTSILETDLEWAEHTHACDVMLMARRERDRAANIAKR